MHRWQARRQIYSPVQIRLFHFITLPLFPFLLHFIHGSADAVN